MRPRSVYAEGLQGRGEWHSGISESVTYPPLPSPITPRPTCSRPPSEAPAAGPGPTLRSCIMRRGGGSAGAAAATARGAPSSTPSLPASDRPLRAVPAPLVTQPCDADASACGGGGKAARPNPMLPRASACECVRAGFGDERVGDETLASVGDGGRASSRMPLSAQPPPPPPSNWCRPPAPPGERPAMSAGKAAAGPARGLKLRGAGRAREWMQASPDAPTHLLSELTSTMRPPGTWSSCCLPRRSCGAWHATTGSGSRRRCPTCHPCRQGSLRRRPTRLRRHLGIRRWSLSRRLQRAVRSRRLQAAAGLRLGSPTAPVLLSHPPTHLRAGQSHGTTACPVSPPIP